MINRLARLPLRKVAVNLFEEDVAFIERTKPGKLSEIVRELLHDELLQDRVAPQRATSKLKDQTRGR